MSLEYSKQATQAEADQIGMGSNEEQSLTGVAVGKNNQAVIELKQSNAQEAIRLSQESVNILYALVNKRQQIGLIHDSEFSQMIQSLLIAYLNLGVSYEMLNQLVTAKKVYE